MRTVLLLLAVALGAPTIGAQPATAHVVVTVTDTLGAPIPGATVQIVGRPGVGVAAASGVAVLEGTAGLAVVVVAADGFEAATFTVALDPGETADGRVTLEPAIRTLQAVEAVADRLDPTLGRVGFYERRAEGRGQYADREAFEARSLHTVEHALTGMSGVYLQGWDGGRVAVSTRSVTGADGALQNAKPCPLAVYVDGHRVGGEAIDISTIPTADLAGVEVYVGMARTPPLYRGFNACGAVLLWTRVE